MAKGNISVNTDNILPVIKKWLYSDKDIFLRELVSNACDAISKMKQTGAINDEYSVRVTVDKKNKTLTFSDNGIGMTADEIEKYIAQVAFSGAEEFLEKYAKESENNTIIGHFGLGFYSAFMVADKVEIESLSFLENSAPAHWSCDGGIEYDITDGTRTTRGTDVILHINEENEEFLEISKVTEILNKYCYFLPVDIYIIDAEKDEKAKPFNDKTPLWLKNPNECTDEEYINFYHTVFHDFDAPLFWIHLNVDYPFNMKGILYFPKLRHEASGLEGQIKLYNNQVFVADNIKEVIPEYLMLLKGCIDCPDLPLNVSRSFLQNDGYVKKVSAHITKKVSDKLTGMFNTKREDLEKYWDDISPFVKYGCMRDDSFYDKIKDIVLYKSTEDNKYYTLSEYLDGNDEKVVFYASNPEIQAQYIAMFKDKKIVLLPYAIDTHFISFMEFKNHEIKFKRIDSAVASDAEKSTENNALISKFKSAVGDENLKVECAALENTKLPAVINLSEQSRRMQEMSALIMGKIGDIPEDITVVLNLASPIVSKLSKSTDEDVNKLISNYIYDIATLAHRPLSSERMSAFIDRSNEILSKIGE
ncbi:MAG: molecular chaperone HtpG [Monoglobales bacterium]